jgi:hypothetical protein
LIIALPLGEKVESIINKFANEEFKYISVTESRFALKPGLFSEAIDCIEEDSNHPLDIVYFLPKGDMGDLILSTKMRTMATHFATENFPNISNFKTSKKLIVYCAYNSSMGANQKFINSFDKIFPQNISQEIIYSEEVTVIKIELSPSKQITEES